MSAHYHTMSSFSIIKELESYGPDLTLTLFTIKPVALTLKPGSEMDVTVSHVEEKQNV